MRTNSLNYKGFFTWVNYDSETHRYYGRIEGIKDLITWEAEEEPEIATYNAFVKAVDDYIKFCDYSNRGIK